MICTKKEFIRTGADGTKWWQVVLTADTDPDTLNLTGADVENLNDALGLAAGSILITPTANYIAFEDGVFQAKGEGGGGGLDGEGVKAVSILGVEMEDDISEYVPLLVREGESQNYIDVELQAAEAISGQELTFVITPTANWVPYFDDGADVYEVGNAGEPLTVTYTPASNTLIVQFAATDDPHADEPKVASIGATIRHGVV